MGRIFRPKTCCCCAPIRLGTQILGWLGLVLSLLNVLAIIRAKAMLNELVATKPYSNVDYESVHNTAGATLIIISIFTVARGISCVLLLIGVSLNKATLLLPYLIVDLLTIILVGLSIIFGIKEQAFCRQWHHLVWTFLIIALFMLLWLHFFSVVRICYKEIKKGGAVEAVSFNMVTVSVVKFPQNQNPPSFTYNQYPQYPPNYTYNQNPPGYINNQNPPGYINNQNPPDYINNQNPPGYLNNQNPPDYTKNQNPPDYTYYQDPPSYSASLKRSDPSEKK